MMSCYFIYFLAVIRHKWYVFYECCKAGIPLQGLMHDNSKFRPSEFIPYAHYWGKKPQDRSEADIRAYHIAVKSHKARNAHHWEWWVQDNGNAKQMDKNARLEMLCDWRGAGQAYNGRDTSSEFYHDNKKQILMDNDTRNWLEHKLGIKKR